MEVFFAMKWHMLLVLSVAAMALAASPRARMDSVLARFTAADIPELGPGEQTVARTWTDPTTVPELPGHEIAEHPMLYAGEGYNNIILVNGGKVIWNYFTGPHG